MQLIIKTQEIKRYKLKKYCSILNLNSDMTVLSTIKKLILIFLVGLFSCETQVETPHLSYEELVTIAEGHILKKDYHRASMIYSIIERSFDPFIKEKNNAFICSYAIKDYQKSYERSKILISSGVPLEYFEDKNFNDFKKTNFFTLLKKEYSELHNLYLQGLDTILIKKLKALVINDQATYCGIPIEKTSLNEARLLTTQVDSILKNLVKKHGFFTEKNTGLNIGRDNSINFPPFYNVLYRHSYQSGSAFFKEDITRAYKAGTIAPEVYYSIFEADDFKIIVINNRIYLNKEFVADTKSNLILARLKFIQEMTLPFILYAPIANLKDIDIPLKLFQDQFFDTKIEIKNDEN